MYSARVGTNPKDQLLQEWEERRSREVEGEVQSDATSGYRLTDRGAWSHDAPNRARVAEDRGAENPQCVATFGSGGQSECRV